MQVEPFDWPESIVAVAFDMDGLLLNTEDLYEEVLNLLLERRGKTYRESTRRKMMGLQAERAFSVLIEEESLNENWLDLQRECDELFAKLLPKRVAPMPGAVSLLERLDRIGMPRCVATSSRREFAELSLRLAGIRSFFDWILTAEDVAHGKPAPDIYLSAAKQFACKPSNMMVLEDSLHGVHAAMAASACTIVIPGAHNASVSYPREVFQADQLDDPRILRLLPGI